MYMQPLKHTEGDIEVSCQIYSYVMTADIKRPKDSVKPDRSIPYCSQIIMYCTHIPDQTEWKQVQQHSLTI